MAVELGKFNEITGVNESMKEANLYELTDSAFTRLSIALLKSQSEWDWTTVCASDCAAYLARIVRCVIDLARWLCSRPNMIRQP